MVLTVAIIVQFTNNGLPATGLSPTIDIWEADGTQIVTAAAMTETTAPGFYTYDFTLYQEHKNYMYRADGGATLPDFDRYTYGSNETFTAVRQK